MDRLPLSPLFLIFGFPVLNIVSLLRVLSLARLVPDCPSPGLQETPAASAPILIRTFTQFSWSVAVPSAFPRSAFHRIPPSRSFCFFWRSSHTSFSLPPKKVFSRLFNALLLVSSTPLGVPPLHFICSDFPRRSSAPTSSLFQVFHTFPLSPNRIVTSPSLFLILRFFF